MQKEFKETFFFEPGIMVNTDEQIIRSDQAWLEEHKLHSYFMTNYLVRPCYDFISRKNCPLYRKCPN